MEMHVEGLFSNSVFKSSVANVLCDRDGVAFSGLMDRGSIPGMEGSIVVNVNGDLVGVWCCFCIDVRLWRIL